MKTFSLIALGILLATIGAIAQDTVPTGKGAYAASIPANVTLDGRTKVNKAAAFDDKPTYLLNDDGTRPIPSNHWDSSLFYQNFGVGLWSYPLMVSTGAQGFQVFFATKWNGEGRDMQTDAPLVVSGDDFAPTGTKVKDWSDWMVNFRLGSGTDKYIDATLGEGMPYLWLEYHGVAPTIQADASAKFFDVTGAPATLPATTDALGIEFGGRDYAVFAPSGTKFESNGAGIAVTFRSGGQFLVICPLPAQKDIATFHSYAFAVPRKTTLSWQYDPDGGTMTSHWKIDAEELRGDSDGKQLPPQIIQGWLPHHYRNNTAKLDFNGIDYLTARGTMHCAVGNDFTLTYPFAGMLPNLPAPKSTTGPNAFNPARLQGMLAEIAAKPSFGNDTYWGGKDLVRNGQAALVARATNDPSRDALVNALRTELVNWFTYTPGKTDHLFVYYPKKKALIGIHSSYGSEEFTDNHFHYGYFTTASALMAMQDPTFAQDYGPMATLVAKQYANWDHNDKRFPFLRTFDVWQGHSWAGGVGSQNGTNNQESSSEATQSWSGLILLGEALGNKDMTAAGIMGYTFESQATMEYWFNAHGDVFPPDWKHPITGMVWSAGLNYGTWFTGDPAWIFGIQWCPSSPALSYFVHDPAWAKQNWDNMLKEYAAHQAEDAARHPDKPAKEADIKSFEGDLLSYMLGYVLMYDSGWVDQKLDEFAAAPGFAHNPWLANIYYMSHAMTEVGHNDWTCHGDSATSMVYLNDATKVRTYVAWNPLSTPQTVKFYEGTKLVGQMNAAPQAITGATSLLTSP